MNKILMINRFHLGKNLHPFINESIRRVKNCGQKEKNFCSPMVIKVTLKACSERINIDILEISSNIMFSPS